MSSASQAPRDTATVKRQKATLRRTIQRQRTTRSEQQRQADDAARFRLLRDFLADGLPETAAIYVSVPPEPSTRELITWLAGRDTRVLLPVLTAPTDTGEVIGPPDWAPYAGPDRLREGRLSIIEPDTEPIGAAGLRVAQLIVCPGLAGNARGERLGRGGGWYDRALAEADPAAVAVLPLNDDELCDQIPLDAWDRRVDVLVTPSRVIPCPSGDR